MLDYDDLQINLEQIGNLVEVRLINVPKKLERKKPRIYAFTLTLTLTSITYQTLFCIVSKFLTFRCAGLGFLWNEIHKRWCIVWCE